MLMPPKPHPPRLFLVPVRVLLVTFLFTLITFALSLFLGILGTGVWAALHHNSPNLRAVYLHFAPPVAATVGIAVLVVFTVIEVRRYKQAKVLAGIERMSAAK